MFLDYALMPSFSQREAEWRAGASDLFWIVLFLFVLLILKVGLVELSPR